MPYAAGSGTGATRPHAAHPSRSPGPKTASPTNALLPHAGQLVHAKGPRDSASLTRSFRAQAGWDPDPAPTEIVR